MRASKCCRSAACVTPASMTPASVVWKAARVMLAPVALLAPASAGMSARRLPPTWRIKAAARASSETGGADMGGPSGGEL